MEKSSSNVLSFLPWASAWVGRGSAVSPGAPLPWGDGRTTWRRAMPHLATHALPWAPSPGLPATQAEPQACRRPAYQGLRQRLSELLWNGGDGACQAGPLLSLLEQQGRMKRPRQLLLCPEETRPAAPEPPKSHHSPAGLQSDPRCWHPDGHCPPVLSRASLQPC